MSLLFDSLGPLGLASRLKRLSERFAQDIAALYREHGYPFEARWFLVFYELGMWGPRPISDLCQRTGNSQVVVDHIINEMVRAGFIHESSPFRERRRKLVGLNDQGKALFQQLQHLWRDIEQATEGVMGETGGNVLGMVSQLEGALERAGLRDRIDKCVKLRQLDLVEIVPYQPSLRKWFESLHRLWFKGRFPDGMPDELLLKNPNRHIINQGGAVFFARLDGHIVGTCATLPHSGDAWELRSIVVAPPYRRRQAGRKMALAGIDRARNSGASALYVRSATHLPEANQMFRSLGFEYLGGDSVRPMKKETLLFRLDLESDRVAP